MISLLGSSSFTAHTTKSRRITAKLLINGIDKGTAVRDVASLLGYSVADTIAIGDSDNDTAMLKAAGISVAMGNAIHGIQAFCDFTTTDIHQDGLANAFKMLGLV